jgi:hypothetical protein
MYIYFFFFPLIKAGEREKRVCIYTFKLKDILKELKTLTHQSCVEFVSKSHVSSCLLYKLGLLVCAYIYIYILYIYIIYIFLIKAGEREKGVCIYTFKRYFEGTTT